MPIATKVAVGAYIAALNFILLALLVRCWPVSLTAAPQPGELSPEGRYLISAAISGALGSYIHLATSFVEHAGANRLVTGWISWYLLRPNIGAALAVTVYFVIRAGLVSGIGDNVSSLNPYGVAAIAAMSGMFSRQATTKLRELFDHFLGLAKRESIPQGEGQ